jgi:hypothetical protein
VDEAIASAIQCDALRGHSLAEILHVHASDVRIVQGAPSVLLGRLQHALERLDACEEHDVITSMLFGMDAPPVGLPARWGYVLGAGIATDARTVMGDWATVLRATARDVLLAAAERRSAVDGQALRRLAASA